MLRLIVFIFLTIFIFPSNCEYHSTSIQKSVLCINNDYIIPLFATKFIRLTFNRTQLDQMHIRTIRIYASIANPKIAEFKDHRNTTKRVFHLINNTKKTNKPMIVYNLQVHALYLNVTYIHYHIETINIENYTDSINCSNILMISQPQRLIDKLFAITIPFVIVFVSVQMGVLLEIEILKELFRRPIQILIGFFCQYSLMPLLAFAISKIFQYPHLHGLGLFVVGCCPGGSASNQWTIVFDGDLTLSASMSFVSTIASFFMLPLWLYTLGQYAYLRQLKLRIPFLNLAQSLLTIVGPLVLGMLIAFCIPKIKPFIKRIVKPILIILICYFFIFGSIANWYLIYYIDLKLVLTAPLLPWLGFLLGGIFAWICRQDYKRIITIGIETGVQNIGVAFIILLYSFPAPENTQALIVPLIVAYFAPQPFHIALIYKIIREKCFKPKKPIHHISSDTLSKTTYQQSEIEPVDDNPQTRKISIPTTILGLSPDCEPFQI